MSPRLISPLLMMMMLLAPSRPIYRAIEMAPEDPDEAQERWFLRQRAYPAAEVPPNARREAFEAMKRRRAMIPDSAAALVWKSLGPAPVVYARESQTIINTGRVASVAISPVDPKVVLVGSSSGGIWRTTDGGATFAAVSDDQIDLAVGSIAFAPSNPNIAYAGMGEDHLGTGVLKSTNAGATWRLVTTASFTARSKSRKIAVDPANENIVWLLQSSMLNSSGSTVSSRQLLKSVDGGATWAAAFNGFVSDFVIASADGSTLLVAAIRAPTFGSGGIYCSTDGGSTWKLVYGQTDLGTPPQYFLAVASGMAYAAESASGELVSSTDGGDHWTQLPRLPETGRFLYLAASPHDPRVLFLGGVTGFRSSDGGLTWTRIETHLDQHAIAFDPTDRSRIWLGNDGGLFRSVDGGATFPLSARCFRSCSSIPSMPIRPTPEFFWAARRTTGCSDKTEMGQSGSSWSRAISASSSLTSMIPRGFCRTVFRATWCAAKLMAAATSNPREPQRRSG